MIRLIRLMAAALPVILATPGHAAEASKAADFTIRDFRFHDGSVIPEMRVHYTTLGDPASPAVLILHGTGGTGAGMLSPSFGAALFGPGQPLDAANHFIVLPDSIGTGGSSKPSDGMRARFPVYDYADMVDAQYRLLTDGLHLRHIRLVVGNSMGGMETWVWGIAHPGFMDGLVPMAAQPTAMAGRNWMMRRLLIESIRQDPEFKGGDYTVQPSSLRLANALFGVGTNGGTLALQEAGDTHAKADDAVDRQLALPPPKDANDFIYQWNSSFDYDPEPLLGRIEAPVLVINSADDERNPPITGVTERALTRVKHAELFLIPASAETRGHGTTGFSRFWADRLRVFDAALPTRPAP